MAGVSPRKLSPESPVLLSDAAVLRDRDPAPLMHI